MTKKIEEAVEAEIKPVEAPVEAEAVQVAEPVQEPVQEPAVEQDVPYPVDADEEDEDTREYGENEVHDPSGLFEQPEQVEDHVYEPDFVNLANSRTLPWESDPYGLLTFFREAAIEAAQHVSGKDDYVTKFKADLALLEQHIDALHVREKEDRLRLIEEQAKRDEEAKKVYRTAQEQRLAELRREAALIKQELEADE